MSVSRWFHRKVHGFPSRFEIECIEQAMVKVNDELWQRMVEGKNDGIEIRLRLPPARLKYQGYCYAKT